MIRQRGYTGSIQRLRCVVARLRPEGKEAFLRLVTFPGAGGLGALRAGSATRSCHGACARWLAGHQLFFELAAARVEADARQLLRAEAHPGRVLNGPALQGLALVEPVKA